jgi:hypothetical protein
MTDTATIAPAPAAQSDTTIEVDKHELAVMAEHPLAPAAPTDFAPKTMDEALRFCDMIVKSDLVPKDYQNKAANAFVAIQRGAEVGLKPIQSLWSIAVINGRPSMWGDSPLALVRSSPHCEYVFETMDDKGTATCTAKRRGEPMEHVVTFSIEDQKTAGLYGKAGPHTNYGKRMRQLRARAFCLRDTFTDVLAGIPQAEEMLFLQPMPQSVAELPRGASASQIAAAAAPRAERTEAHTKIIRDLDGLAFNKGTKALSEAWAALSREDRVAIGADELHRLQAKAKECDDVVAAAANDAAREAAQAQSSEGGNA